MPSFSITSVPRRREGDRERRVKVDDNASVLRGVDAGSSRRVVDIPEKGGVVMRRFRFREYCFFQPRQQAGCNSTSLRARERFLSREKNVLRAPRGESLAGPTYPYQVIRAMAHKKKKVSTKQMNRTQPIILLMIRE